MNKLNVPRHHLVISTKIYWGNSKNFPNTNGLSRKHIIEGTKRSLQRLGLDYVDVIFCHRPDYDTPMEETCRAFDWVVRKGLAYYWGTS